MSTIAYGLGQGFTQGADNIANTIATAERIKNNREQLRIQNQYAQLAQDKWGVQKQQDELAIREATMKLDALENEMVANKASNFLIDGYEYGNYKQFQNFALTNQKMKGILNTLGIVNIEGLNDYTDKSIDAIAGNQELANQIRQNRNGYLVVTDSKGNKSLVDTMLLAGQMGVQKYVNMNRVEGMNALQSRYLEQAQTAAIKNQTAEAMKDPLNYNSAKAVEQYLVANPGAGIGLAQAQAQKTKKLDYQNFLRDTESKFGDLSATTSSGEKPTEQQAESAYTKGIELFATAGIKTLDDAYSVLNDPNASNEVKTLVKRELGALDSLSPKGAKNVDKLIQDSEVYKTIDNFAKLSTDLQNYDPAKFAPTEKMIQDVAKFFNVSGEQAKEIIKDREIMSNFQTISNTIRHALYGSALTATEVADFEKAMGSIAQSKANMLIGLDNLLTQSMSVFDQARRLHTNHFDWKYSANKNKLQNAHNRIRQQISDMKKEGGRTTTTKPSAVVGNLTSQSQAQSSNISNFRQATARPQGVQ